MQAHGIQGSLIGPYDKSTWDGIVSGLGSHRSSSPTPFQRDHNFFHSGNAKCFLLWDSWRNPARRLNFQLVDWVTSPLQGWEGGRQDKKLDSYKPRKGVERGVFWDTVQRGRGGRSVWIFLIWCAGSKPHVSQGGKKMRESIESRKWLSRWLCS